MIGLFWITEDCVYVGAKPVGTASGLRLTTDGVRALGIEDGTSFWSWDEVRRIEVSDVPVRSGARRLASVAFDAVVAAVTGDAEMPPAFTARVATPDGSVEVSVVAGVAGGLYTPVEFELSSTLLERLTDGGGALLADLLAWGRDHAAEGTPRREERQALLRKWGA